MDQKTIIMNFTAPPASEDLAEMARAILAALPDEIARQCEDIALEVEEFPDPATEQDQELESPYDLLCLFRPAREVAPGITRKVANGDDLLVLYRRPILDMWCDSGEDLAALMRQVILGELGQAFEFSEEEIDQFAAALAVNS